MNPPSTDTFPTPGGATESDLRASGPVIAFPRRPPSAGGNPLDRVLGALAVLVALAMAASPLAVGYYNFSAWAPLTLVATVLLVVVVWTRPPAVGRRALWAGAGIVLLLALSAASMLWAQSKESAWTDTNRLALYVIVFLIALLTIRDRRTARVVVMILGLAALATSLLLPAEFILGHGASAFLTRRLNSPIGYINGTAGLLVMGIWPWLASAQAATRRHLRALSLGAATLIAATFVLTESRAVIPATVLTAVIALACAPGRTRRAINLIVLTGSVAATLPWTLRVYSQGGVAARNLLPVQASLREAGLAILLGGVLATAAAGLIDALAARVPAGRRARLSHRIGSAMLAIAVVGTLGAIIAGHGYIGRQWNAFTALKVNQSASVRFVDASGFRYDLWHVAVDEFRTHPLDGVGAGNYDTDYYRLRQNPEYVLQPHSLELQMAAELGIGGIVALLLFGGAVLGAGFARRGTLAAEDPLLRIAALGVFAAWLIDTSVDWLWDIPGLTGMAMIAGAILLLPAPRPDTSTMPGSGGSTNPTASPLTVPARRRRQSSGVRAALLTMLALLALLAASVGRQYVASRYAASGESEISRSPRVALGDLRTALKLDPYALTTLYSIASAYARLDQYDDARAALTLAEQREPTNYVPPALLGDLAVRAGYLSVALSDYQHALALNPGDPEVQQSVAQTEAALHP